MWDTYNTVFIVFPLNMITSHSPLLSIVQTIEMLLTWQFQWIGATLWRNGVFKEFYCMDFPAVSCEEEVPFHTDAVPLSRLGSTILLVINFLNKVSGAVFRTGRPVPIFNSCRYCINKPQVLCWRDRNLICSYGMCSISCQSLILIWKAVPYVHWLSSVITQCPS